MAADLQASAYLVDGTDLAVAGCDLTHDGSGLWSGRSEDVSLSEQVGAEADIVGGLYRPTSHSTMYEIRGDGFDAVWAAVVALRRRCKPGRTVTLTRTMPDPDGTAANTSHTTQARRQGDRVEWLGDSMALVDIDWTVSRIWHGSSVSIGAVGAVTVKGDSPTRRITVTLAAGAVNPIVTNTTNGYTFRYVGTVPTGGVTVDVVNRRASKVSDSSDVSSAMRWSKGDLLVLDPGSNTLTISTGSASLAYLPAYL